MNMQRVMAEKRHLIVPLVLVIVANALLYALVVFPLGRQARNAEEEARVQREQLGAQREIVANQVRGYVVAALNLAGR